MKIKYMCTYWGCEHQSAKAFLNAVLANGYNGVEINFPNDKSFVEEFMFELEKIRKTVEPHFIFIAQQVLSNRAETVEEYTQRMKEQLDLLVSLKPDAINSHTGKDYYDFHENCKIIEIAEQIAKDSGIPIWHEIHRGRFSFHAKTLLNYLEYFQELMLIADFSHFCVVSESSLKDQKSILTQLYPNVKHIHARIGFEQSPQVNNPFAPEWKNHLEQYLVWWQEIIMAQAKQGITEMTITPEFGPFPYMPQEPFTQKPLANQWDTNLMMKHYLQQNLNT